MRVLKNTITKRLALLYLILLVMAGCNNSLDVSQVPCPFPPGESNFPVFPEPGVFCKECYFNIEFRGEEYSFEGNQLKTSWTGLSEAHNSFFSFYFAPPTSVNELYDSISVKTPLLKLYTVLYSDPENSPPAGTAEFGMYNYCKDLFEPIIGDVSQSWHQLIELELIESYPVERDDGPHQLNIFYFYGELEMTFLINGDLQDAIATYKLQGSIEEKL
jgi:hypothetical protein